MRNRFLFLLICFISIILVSPILQAEDDPFPIYYSPEKDIKVDGLFDDWPDTIPCILASDTQVREGSRETMKDFFGIIQFFFNNNNMYIAAVINDTTPLLNDFEGNDIYQGDCLEVYLGFHKEQRRSYTTGDFQFGFSLNPGGVETWSWTKGRELEDYDIEIVEREDAYLVELRVSLSNFIDRSLKANEIIWFDFALDDGTGKNARESQLVWYGDGTGWQTPEVWEKGELISEETLFMQPRILTPPEFTSGKRHRIYVWEDGEAWRGNLDVNSRTVVPESDGGFILDFEGEGIYTMTADINGQKLQKNVNVEKKKEIRLISFDTRSIKINQQGYLQNEEKIFVLTDNDHKLEGEDFQIILPLSEELVFEGVLEGPVIDSTTGDILYYGNFSDLKEEGRYKIRIKGFEDSYVFRIDNRVFADLFYETMRSYYLQRCGQEIDDKISGISHAACHLEDAVYRNNPEMKKNVTGGWHDAGDYGKYIPTAGVTVAQLSLLYELKGEKLNDFSLDIPEAENLPDFLAELKYELDWMLTMQDEDGGVYHKVNTINFPGMILPDDDNQRRYIYEKGTTDTAIFAGAMACAYRAFKDIEPEYSTKLAEAAVKAGEFLLDNDVLWPSNDNTGEYKSSSLVDELYWAYAELFRLTGREEFYEEAELMNQLIDGIPPFSWDDTTLLAIHALIKAEDTPDILRGKLERAILSEAGKIVKRVEDNGYKVALDDNEYYWASNKVTLAHGLSLILANELYPDKDFIDAARRQLDYILGVNTISKSFITDIGTDRVRYPHHRMVEAGGKIVPGLMVGGPNDNAEDGLYQQGLKQGGYVDMSEAYSCNEYAIDYNAPLVFLAGYFMDE